MEVAEELEANIGASQSLIQIKSGLDGPIVDESWVNLVNLVPACIEESKSWAATIQLASNNKIKGAARGIPEI